MDKILETIREVYPDMDVEQLSVNLEHSPLMAGNDDPTEININIRLIKKTEL